MVGTRAMNVLVYSGDGVSTTSLEHARASLRALLAHRYDVMTVDANVLRSEPWTEQCALLVFPGGRDLPYLRDLAGTANLRILSYVRRGGRYLGICAGAYYASARVEFELGGPLAVEGSRELAFFPGVCQGSEFPGFQYNSVVGARAAAIRVDPGVLGDEDLPEELRVYHNGGGAFMGADSMPGVTVLARYADADARFPEPSGLGAAAVVDCQVGSGRAILTGLHPEYIPSRLDPADCAGVDCAAPFAALIQDNPARERLLSALLSRLGLETSSAASAEDPACTPLYLTCASEALLRRVADAWAARFVPGTTTIRDARDVFNVVEGGCCCSTGAPENEKTIVVTPAGSAPPASLTPGFDVERYLGYLKKCQREAEANQCDAGVLGELSFGSALLYASVTESTQNLLENTSFTESLPDGFTFVAARQLQGRGRGRNSWISPPGCLQFSTYVRHPLAAAPLTVFIQYIAALAVVQAVKQRVGYEDVPIALKWPNDIYAELPEDDGAGEAKLVKIGGVLVNSTFHNDEFRLVVGIGVNVNTSLMTSVNELISRKNAACRTAGRGETPLKPLEMEDLLASALCTFELYHRVLVRHGFGGKALTDYDGMPVSLKDLYLRRWLHSNQRITLLTETPSVDVVICGVTDKFGFLQCRAADGSGREYALQPDGNSFDMMKGLLMTKRSA